RRAAGKGYTPGRTPFEFASPFGTAGVTESFDDSEVHDSEAFERREPGRERHALCIPARAGCRATPRAGIHNAGRGERIRLADLLLGLESAPVQDHLPRFPRSPGLKPLQVVLDGEVVGDDG